MNFHLIFVMFLIGNTIFVDVQSALARQKHQTSARQRHSMRRGAFIMQQEYNAIIAKRNDVAALQSSTQVAALQPSTRIVVPDNSQLIFHDRCQNQSHDKFPLVSHDPYQIQSVKDTVGSVVSLSSSMPVPYMGLTPVHDVIPHNNMNIEEKIQDAKSMILEIKTLLPTNFVCLSAEDRDVLEAQYNRIKNGDLYNRIERCALQPDIALTRLEIPAGFDDMVDSLKTIKKVLLEASLKAYVLPSLFDSLSTEQIRQACPKATIVSCPNEIRLIFFEIQQ